MFKYSQLTHAGVALPRRTWVLAKTLPPALLIALVVRTFIIEPFDIPSGSMEPTLVVGDYIFVPKFAYGYSAASLPSDLQLFKGRAFFFHKPQRGDVVVFRLPADPSIDFVKRIVGLPGDRIQVKQGVLYINGTGVERHWLGVYVVHDGAAAIPAVEYRETLPNGKRHLILQFGNGNGPFDNTPVFVVPAGHYFMMGDNRDDSADSRDPYNGVGFVPVDNLVGPASVIFFSIKPTAPTWEFWKWPSEIRFGRIPSFVD
jgi:signal peptidase I